MNNSGLGSDPQRSVGENIIQAKMKSNMLVHFKLKPKDEDQLLSVSY